MSVMDVQRVEQKMNRRVVVQMEVREVLVSWQHRLALEVAVVVAHGGMAMVHRYLLLGHRLNSLGLRVRLDLLGLLDRVRNHHTLLVVDHMTDVLL